MNPMNFFKSLSPGARVGLLLGLALLLAATVAAFWWLLAPRQQLLFGGLRENDAAEIVQSLNEWKVPHRIVDGGTAITVPEDAVYQTRMRLVSAGVPRGGHVGFELFDDSDFGVTEFAQRVNYQRALQGEIERTIAALPGVQNARVHLTIRRPGLFVGEKEASKASVALTLRPGETLNRQQIHGVRSLVAAAVEGLSAQNVAVLDSEGALLAATGGDGAVDLDGRHEDEARLEERIRARVVELLGQVLRNEEFRVSVDATLNYDAVREVSERPLAQGDDGNGLLLRRRVNSAGSNGAEGRNQNNEESEYLHGTEREEIARAPGRIERLSVAVILPPDLDEQEVARIHSLVAAAAGVDSERGDRLEVSRLARGKGWNVLRGPSPELGDRPVAAPAVTPAPSANSAPLTPARGLFAGREPWLWGLIGLIGVLLGAIVAFALPRGPRRLAADEREAVLAKLRGWLAEGGSPT